MLPNIPPKLFSGSAVLVGYLLMDDATAEEQNALGNWLMLVAQVLSTNAFYKALLTSRGRDTETGRNNANTVPLSSQRNYQNRRYNQNNRQNRGNSYSNTNQDDTEETLIMLQKMVKAIQTEIDQIKKDL